MAKKEKEKEAAEVQAEEIVEETEEVVVSEENSELLEMKDRYMRLLAEYDNYRKRSQKEKETTYSNAKIDVIKAFLPVFDNLERALQQHTDDEAYYAGVQLIMNQFNEIISKLGVEIYGTEGDAFDPEVHSGVMHVEDENFEENSIAEVFQKGFKLGEKVVRFAVVKVAN